MICPTCRRPAYAVRPALGVVCREGHAWAAPDALGRLVYEAVGGMSWDAETEATRERYRAAAVTIRDGLARG